jgi:hypothetical protein
VPRDVAMELTMSARIVGADEARRVGLVSHVADDPLAAALALAAETAEYSPDALAAAKELLDAAYAHGEGEREVLARETATQKRLLAGRNQVGLNLFLSSSFVPHSFFWRGSGATRPPRPRWGRARGGARLLRCCGGAGNRSRTSRHRARLFFACDTAGPVVARDDWLCCHAAPQVTAALRNFTPPGMYRVGYAARSYKP